MSLIGLRTALGGLVRERALEVAPRADLELAVGGVQVRLDRRPGDEQCLSDLGVREAVGGDIMKNVAANTPTASTATPPYSRTLPSSDERRGGGAARRSPPNPCGRLAP